MNLYRNSQEMGISENLIQTYKNKNGIGTVPLCIYLNNEDWRIKADSKLNLSDPNIYSKLFTTPSPIPKPFTKILTHLSLAISTKPLQTTLYYSTKHINHQSPNSKYSIINSPQTQDEEEGRDESQLVKPYQITFENFDFSEKMGCLCEILQICIDEEIIRVAFEKCVFPYVTEKGVSQLSFITPQEQMRPFYGISFTECEFIQNLELLDEPTVAEDSVGSQVNEVSSTGLTSEGEGLHGEGTKENVVADLGRSVEATTQSSDNSEPNDHSKPSDHSEPNDNPTSKSSLPRNMFPNFPLPAYSPHSKIRSTPPSNHPSHSLLEDLISKTETRSSPEEIFSGSSEEVKVEDIEAGVAQGINERGQMEQQRRFLMEEIEK